MKDYSLSIENARIVDVVDNGVYEVARLSLPSAPLYEIRTIWQFLQFWNREPGQHNAPWMASNTWWMPFGGIFGTFNTRWSLRLCEVGERGAGDYIGAGTIAADRFVSGEAIAAWADRDFVSDHWGSTVRHSLVLAGPAQLRLFATVSGELQQDIIYRIGGRLHGYVFDGLSPNDPGY